MTSSPANAAQPYCSLVLATVGRSAEMDPLLDTLIGQTSRDFELIVVDQNEDDRLVPHLARATAAGIVVRHVRCPKRGLSFARNHGLDIARGEIVAFPDDDCWYDLDVIEQVRRAFETTDGLEGVVGRWVEEDPDRQRPAHALSFETWHALRGGDASSICLFLSRPLVERAGRFDDRLGAGAWFAAGEETDLVLRMLRGGASLRFVSEVGVHHARSQPLTRWVSGAFRDTLRRGRGTGALYAKHRMSAWVVMRGISSPVIKGLVSGRPILRGAYGACSSFGRLHGMLRWRLRDGRERH